MGKMPLLIAICDDLSEDRQALRTQLCAYLGQNGISAEITEFSSGEAFLSCEIERFALVFLDIFMNGINGMETAKQLIARHSGTQIVFCSTSREFAAESYEVDALHYLVKPVETERLRRVLDRFFDGWNALRTLSLKVGRTEEEVLISDIRYLEASGKHCIVYTRSGPLEVSATLSELYALLPTEEFVRPIRYAAVALREVTKIPSTELELTDGAKIAISRGEREHMKQCFFDYKWRKLRRGTGV